MPRTGWTPSVVPPEGDGDDQNVYLVVDDLGRNGRVYREADVDLADLETVILDLLSGEYKNPFASSPLTLPKAGRRMSRRISPKSCAAAVVATLGWQQLGCDQPSGDHPANTTASTGS
jgi:hypothetical protein